MKHIIYRNSKQTILILLVAILLVISGKNVAKAKEQYNISGFLVEPVDNNSWCIVGYWGNAGDITIPNELEGKKVVSIEDNAFMGCNSLTSVTISKGITSIGNSAFENCRTLTSITIPEGITGISNRTFNYCENLKSITIPEGVTGIGNAAFENCRALTSITIPKSVTSIGDSAFLSCSSLTNITIPEGVTCINRYTFGHCSSLSNITIPESVTGIGDNAFVGCSSLSNIDIPDSITDIAADAFWGCSSLTDIKIPKNLTKLKNGVFRDCSSLKNITIQEGITEIDLSAFKGCSSLTRIELPSSVTKAYTDYFSLSGCTNLMCIVVHDEQCANQLAWGMQWKSITCDVIYIGGKHTKLYSYSELSTFEVTASDSHNVAYVGTNNQKATSITVPKTVTVNNITYKVTSIADGAVSNNKTIKKVTLGENVSSVGKNAFSGDKKLANVVIKSKKITRIGKKAFYRKGGKMLTIKVPKAKKNKYKKLLTKAKTNKYKIQ